MITNVQFKFKCKTTASGFCQELSRRIDDYFHTRGISKRANAEMVFKSILGVALWIGTYVWLMTGGFSSLGVIGVYVLHGAAQLFMGLNIGHDANHGAYAKSKRVNRALGRVFDLVGMSSYMWRLMHNDAHHVFVNIRGADTALESGNLFRFTPHDKRRPFHRYQHIYAPFFYCLSTLDWAFAKDYRWLLLEKRFGNRHVVKHPLGEVLFLFGAKAFYYTYILVLPLLYLKVPWQAVVGGFVAMHFFLGFTLALTFQPNHFTDGSVFTEPDEEGGISTNSIKHIFDTTVDYARGNPFANFALGGLNLHVIHHMFPGICHVHYPALTQIIKSTAEDFGLPYRENRTITRAFIAHLKWIKMLGRRDGNLTPPIPSGSIAEPIARGQTSRA